MSRDPERIARVLEQIRLAWEKVPDLRLGQLLLNLMTDPELYYVDDEALATRVEKFVVEHYKPVSQ